MLKRNENYSDIINFFFSFHLKYQQYNCVERFYVNRNLYGNYFPIVEQHSSLSSAFLENELEQTSFL